MEEFPFSLVGFDLDGTLFDTHADLGHAVNHALARAGRQAIPLAEIRDLIGGGARLMLKRAMARTGAFEPELFEPLYADLLAHYEANIAVYTRLFPGGEAMLDALAERRVAVALVTNKLERLARRLVEELGLADRFFAVIGGDTLGPGRGKPEPDLLLEMVARGPAGRAVYIGDTTYDTRAARAAGIPCVAVRFGFGDAQSDELGADAVIDSFAELIPALERL